MYHTGGDSGRDGQQQHQDLSQYFQQACGVGGGAYYYEHRQEYGVAGQYRHVEQHRVMRGGGRHLEQHCVMRDHSPAMLSSRPSVEFYVQQTPQITYHPQALVSSRPSVEFHVQQPPQIRTIQLGYPEHHQTNRELEFHVQQAPQISGYKPREQQTLEVAADIKIKDLKLDRKIGSGSFGTVYKGKWKGNVVAIKRVPMTLTEIPQEIEIARKLRHPNIVTLLGAIITEMEFYMVNQYIEGSNLCQLLHHTGVKTELQLEANGYVAYQVALGLQYLHNNKIVHRDLKPANILVEANSRKTYICDFGLSKQRETLASVSSMRDPNFKGTIAYCAEESLDEENKMKSKPCVDVYSFGCVLYEIYSRKIVWKELGMRQIMTKILTCRYPSLNDINDASVKGLLSNIFVKAEQRPTIDEILHRVKCLVHDQYAGYV